MTKVNIDLWVLLVGVALPSVCLLLISLSYCWRRLTRGRRKSNLKPDADTSAFNQQVLLEMVLQQSDNAFNGIIEAVYQQRIELLTLLETHHLKPLLSTAAPSAANTATQSLVSKEPAVSEGASVSTEVPAQAHTPTTTARIRTKETAAVFDPYSQIPEQIQNGLSTAEVAKRLNLPESAVELYVKLRLSSSQDGKQKTA